jgi:hypothetical protein
MQADVERLMARLLTDREFRQRFVADPSGVARDEGLSPEEAQAVAQMPIRDLHTAARSYHHKRASNGQHQRRGWLARWFGVKR